MRVLFSAALAAAALVFPACVRTVSLPAEEAAALDRLGKNQVLEFVEHYRSLFHEQRPPTPEEYGRWSAKWELLQQIYQYVKGRISVNEIDSDLLRRLLRSQDIGALETLINAVF